MDKELQKRLGEIKNKYSDVDRKDYGVKGMKWGEHKPEDVGTHKTGQKVASVISELSKTPRQTWGKEDLERVAEQFSKAKDEELYQIIESSNQARSSTSDFKAFMNNTNYFMLAMGELQDRKNPDRADYGVKGMKWGEHKAEEETSAKPSGGSSPISADSVKELNDLNTSVNNGGKGNKERASEILNNAPIGQKLYCKGERGTKYTLEKTGENTWSHSSKDGPYEIKTGQVAGLFGSSPFSNTFVQVSDKPFEEEKKSGIGRLTPQDKIKSRVMATGNKWAIENWNATHGR